MCRRPWASGFGLSATGSASGPCWSCPRGPCSCRTWRWLVLLAGGIGAGVTGHWFGQGWIWAALGLLAVLTATTIPVAVPYYRLVRRALDEATDEEVAELLDSPRPVILAWLGSAVLLLILWLMVFKPF
ncbi:MAG TPA: DUF2269 family protein [Actinomycetota bacterium]